MWSLTFFLAANWREFSIYLRQRLADNDEANENFSERITTKIAKIIGNLILSKSDRPVPKVEDETVHLNIALQKEIVRFTALGVQKAVRDFGVSR